MTLKLEELQERRDKMLEFQQEIYPFTPTVRDLMKVWGLKSECVVVNTLKHLVDLEYVITRRIGIKGHSYYAVDK